MSGLILVNLGLDLLYIAEEYRTAAAAALGGHFVVKIFSFQGAMDFPLDVVFFCTETQDFVLNARSYVVIEDALSLGSGPRRCLAVREVVDYVLRKLIANEKRGSVGEPDTPRLACRCGRRSVPQRAWTAWHP